MTPTVAHDIIHIMKVTKNNSNKVIIELEVYEAQVFRQWIDAHNNNDTENDHFVDDISDALFDFSYSPVTERPRL